jgi:hypothetical protein
VLAPVCWSSYVVLVLAGVGRQVLVHATVRWCRLTAVACLCLWSVCLACAANCMRVLPCGIFLHGAMSPWALSKGCSGVGKWGGPAYLCSFTFCTLLICGVGFITHLCPGSALYVMTWWVVLWQVAVRGGICSAGGVGWDLFPWHLGLCMVLACRGLCWWSHILESGGVVTWCHVLRYVFGVVWTYVYTGARLMCTTFVWAYSCT